MNLLYAHDHKLKHMGNCFYTTGGFSDQVTARYTDVFGSMTLMCRGVETTNIDGCLKIENENVKIRPLYCGKVLPTRENLRIIREEIKRADKVMVRLPSLLGLYTAFSALKQNKSISVEVVGSAFGSYWFKSLSGKILALPLEFLNKIVIKKAAYVLYVTEDYLQKEYPANGIIEGCSDVVLEARDESVLNNRLKKIITKTDNPIILGTLAQVDYKYKGHETVIEAISKLREKGLKFEYRLAGSGKREYIESIASKYGVLENIEFYGQINHKDINKWLSNLDIYIQPSLTEGMPRSVIEGLYRAVPIIVSDAGGMYELVEPDYTYEKGNANELVKVLYSIDRDRLCNMAKRNYYFAEKFNYSILQNKRNMFYQRIKDDEMV